jgi:DNA-binding NarL/FixJ family response regulator
MKLNKFLTGKPVKISHMNNNIDSTISKSESKGLITVMIADDHPLVRQALRNLLEDKPDIKLIGEACDGDEIIKKATQSIPDVILMDITMPKINGLEATREIKKRYPQIKILVLTIHDDSEQILGILEAGAVGYLTKSVFGEEIINAIRSVMTGESVVSAQVMRQILKHVLQIKGKSGVCATADNLSVREAVILKLAASGRSNKEIALELDLSIPTIKGYFANIFSKLRVNSRTEAVITGLRVGILSINDLEH